jgi:hypothetical protein
MPGGRDILPHLRCRPRHCGTLDGRHAAADAASHLRPIAIERALHDEIDKDRVKGSEVAEPSPATFPRGESPSSQNPGI